MQVLKQEFWSRRGTKLLNSEGPLRYQKVMDYYDFWICCEPLNKKNFNSNFVSFGVKLKKL